MFLKEIQATIQQIVVAISAVLKLEVEIADHKLFRIAGTGAVKSGIWQNMSNEDFVYRECLRTGKPVIVENPGHHTLCAPCVHYQNCKEYGEVCTPILLEQRVLGVIGLIAFTDEQRNRLFHDVDAKIDFLNKMAGLIAAKIKESELMEEHNRIEQKLSMLIGYIDDGVIMINHEGECHFMNPAARRLLHIPEDCNPDHELMDQILSPFRLSAQLSTRDSEGKLIVVKTKYKIIHLFATYHASMQDDSIQDAFIIIADPEHMADVGFRYTEESQRGFESIIGNHPLIQSLKEMLRKIANGYSSVLIRGESGTGKEYIAESIHRYSNRKHKPYIALNCAVLPEAVLNKQLFGADQLYGKLAEANGGILFLDDVAEMPMSIQLKLLRVLEEKCLWIYGKPSEAPLDLRMISATDKDLEVMVSKGLFRQDLYYKLSVIPLEVPPLRERKQDILLLANHFLQIHSKSNHKYIQTLHDEVKQILTSYHWPGNIRELSNIMEYAVNFSNDTYINKANLPEMLRNLEVNDGKQDMNSIYNLRTLEKETVTRAVQAVLERGEAKEKAADWLGISRATLFRKLQQYGLNE